MYFSYYAAGFRVAKIMSGELVETGHYIDVGGNNFWGVQVFQSGGQELVAANPKTVADVKAGKFTSEAQVRQELTRLGVKELRTPAEVDALVRDTPGTVMVVVNSMCGCAAVAASVPGTDCSAATVAGTAQTSGATAR